MDLLEQYKQQNPQAFQEQKQSPPVDEYGREHGGMIRLAIRISGGRIQNTKQAHYVLLGVAVVAAATGIILFFAASFAPESAEIYSPVAEPFDSQTRLP